MLVSMLTIGFCWLAQLLSVAGPHGIQLSAKVTLAVENGPVVLEYKLVNRGRESVDLLLDDKAGRFRLRSVFVGSSSPDPRPSRLSSSSKAWLETGFRGPGRLSPGDSTPLRRVYLHNRGVFRDARTYRLALNWPFGLLLDDKHVGIRLAMANVEFTVRPDTATVRNDLYEQIADVLAGPRLDSADYLHWSFVLAGCRDPMYRPLALAMLARPSTDGWPDKAIDALVAAIYNCSSSPADAARFLFAAIADGKVTSIVPFLDFWDQQEGVKRDLTRMGCQLLGTEPVDWHFWLMSPRDQTLANINLRHPVMHLEPGKWKALRAIPNPSLRMLILLRQPDAFDRREAAVIQRQFAQSIGPIEQSEFDKLLEELRSSSFQARETAKKTLSGYGYRVRDQLTRSIRSEADAEARARQEQLLAALAIRPVAPQFFELMQAARQANKSAGRPVLKALADSQMPESFRKLGREALHEFDPRK